MIVHFTENERKFLADCNNPGSIDLLLSQECNNYPVPTDEELAIDLRANALASPGSYEQRWDINGKAVKQKLVSASTEQLAVIMRAVTRLWQHCQDEDAEEIFLKQCEDAETVFALFLETGMDGNSCSPAMQMTKPARHQRQGQSTLSWMRANIGHITNVMSIDCIVTGMIGYLSACRLFINGHKENQSAVLSWRPGKYTDHRWRTMCFLWLRTSAWRFMPALPRRFRDGDGTARRRLPGRAEPKTQPISAAGSGQRLD